MSRTSVDAPRGIVCSESASQRGIEGAAQQTSSGAERPDPRNSACPAQSGETQRDKLIKLSADAEIRSQLVLGERPERPRLVPVHPQHRLDAAWAPRQDLRPGAVPAGPSALLEVSSRRAPHFAEQTRKTDLGSDELARDAGGEVLCQSGGRGESEPRRELPAGGQIRMPARAAEEDRAGPVQLGIEGPLVAEPADHRERLDRTKAHVRAGRIEGGPRVAVGDARL